VVDAIEAGGGPFERLAEIEIFEAVGAGDFLVKIADEREGEVVAGVAPPIIPTDEAAGELQGTRTTVSPVPRGGRGAAREGSGGE